MRNCIGIMISCLLVLGSGMEGADDQTLARLGFWVPVERMTEFEAAYEKQMVPILKRHGLKEWSGPVRATADSVFARVFVFDTAIAFSETYQALLADPAFQKIARNLGDTFGTRGGVSRYDTQAFTSFTTQNGLIDNRVSSIVQDREGRLWFGTARGVSRYNGETLTTFTDLDGLAHSDIYSIYQDRDGALWFGHYLGVSRYDDEIVTGFTGLDGIGNFGVRSIVQNRDGVFWFRNVGRGISRYDGKTFSTFTTKNGLTENRVYSIFEDREGSMWFCGSAGVSRYDGKAVTTPRQKMGLLRTG